MDNGMETPSIENIELRTRTKGGLSVHIKNNYINNLSRSYGDNIVFMERKIRQGDSINKIALQYNVSVPDIKRYNNIVNDQEIYALKSIRIPVTELKRDFLLKQMDKENYSTSDDFDNYSDERTKLINNESDREPSVEDLFVKTDTLMAQARDALPIDEENIGKYHFVDAKSPNNTSNIWMIIFAVILIFVIVPLLLTVIEEETQVEHSSGNDDDHEMMYHFKNN
uniref:LysM domain-containing protein n=1 Tax=Strongyloides papillosus TaxID=174720 RepID=A0A0N5CID6_STREA